MKLYILPLIILLVAVAAWGQLEEKHLKNFDLCSYSAENLEGATKKLFSLIEGDLGRIWERLGILMEGASFKETDVPFEYASDADFKRKFKGRIVETVLTADLNCDLRDENRNLWIVTFVFDKFGSVIENELLVGMEGNNFIGRNVDFDGRYLLSEIALENAIQSYLRSVSNNWDDLEKWLLEGGLTVSDKINEEFYRVQRPPITSSIQAILSGDDGLLALVSVDKHGKVIDIR